MLRLLGWKPAAERYHPLDVRHPSYNAPRETGLRKKPREAAPQDRQEWRPEKRRADPQKPPPAPPQPAPRPKPAAAPWGAKAPRPAGPWQKPAATAPGALAEARLARAREAVMNPPAPPPGSPLPQLPARRRRRNGTSLTRLMFQAVGFLLLVVLLRIFFPN